MLDDVETGRMELPDHELLVGGFPCQDYSVARTLNQAAGLEGRKGVLWWQIHRILEWKRPLMLFLENVDRLLKSPATQRGRDFAIMLASLADLGYLVEWRVVNAADYGFPQRRRRVFIVGHHVGPGASPAIDSMTWLLADGPLARALPARLKYGTDSLLTLDGPEPADFSLDGDLVGVSEGFGVGFPVTPFQSGGVMWDRQVWTRRLEAISKGPRATLGDVVVSDTEVPEHYFIPPGQLPTWEYLKGAKREERVHAASGGRYHYSEGAIAFPDPLDQPSRTILTGEGGSSPSRFKHVVQTKDGRYRRLTPVELERLNGFPDGWTDTGMRDTRRAFMMGNALVVGLVERIGKSLTVDELARAGLPAVLAAR